MFIEDAQYHRSRERACHEAETGAVSRDVAAVHDRLGDQHAERATSGELAALRMMLE